MQLTTEESGIVRSKMGCSAPSTTVDPKPADEPKIDQAKDNVVNDTETIMKPTSSNPPFTPSKRETVKLAPEHVENVQDDTYTNPPPKKPVAEPEAPKAAKNQKARTTQEYTLVAEKEFHFEQGNDLANQFQLVAVSGQKFSFVVSARHAVIKLLKADEFPLKKETEVIVEHNVETELEFEFVQKALEAVTIVVSGSSGTLTIRSNKPILSLMELN